MTDKRINLTVVEAQVKLLAGQPPYTPDSFTMFGHNEDGEFFVVTTVEKDVEIAFGLERMWQLLNDRLQGAMKS